MPNLMSNLAYLVDAACDRILKELIVVQCPHLEERIKQGVTPYSSLEIMCFCSVPHIPTIGEKKVKVRKVTVIGYIHCSYEYITSRFAMDKLDYYTYGDSLLGFKKLPELTHTLDEIEEVRVFLKEEKHSIQLVKEIMKSRLLLVQLIMFNRTCEGIIVRIKGTNIVRRLLKL